MTFADLHIQHTRGPPISISQCTTFSGTAGNCTSSKFELSDLSFHHIEGTSSTAVVASLQCSAVKPCRNIVITDADIITLSSNGTSAAAAQYLCGNVIGTKGFNCTGPVCVGASATGGC